MKIIVTGSSGLIGSHLVPELKDQGHEIRGFDYNKGNDQYEPLEDIKLIPYWDDPNFQGLDLIVHLAALLDRTAPLPELLETNVTGTANVLEAANGIPTLVMSSAAALHSKEDRYGLSKKLMEDVCEHYENVSIMRLANVYHDQLNRRDVISKFLTACKEGNPIEIHGDGKQLREFVPIDFVIKNILEWVENPDSSRNYSYMRNHRRILQLGSYMSSPIIGLAQFIQNKWNEYTEKMIPIYFVQNSEAGIEHGEFPDNRSEYVSTNRDLDRLLETDLERMIKEIVNA